MSMRNNRRKKEEEKQYTSLRDRALEKQKRERKAGQKKERWNVLSRQLLKREASDATS